MAAGLATGFFAAGGAVFFGDCAFTFAFGADCFARAGAIAGFLFVAGLTGFLLTLSAGLLEAFADDLADDLADTLVDAFVDAFVDALDGLARIAAFGVALAAGFLLFAACGLALTAGLAAVLVLAVTLVVDLAALGFAFGLVLLVVRLADAFFAVAMFCSCTHQRGLSMSSSDVI